MVNGEQMEDVEYFVCTPRSLRTTRKVEALTVQRVLMGVPSYHLY